MPSLLWKTELDHGPVILAAGRVVTGKGDVAAASGSKVFLFVPEDGEYRRYSVFDVGEDITGLAVARMEAAAGNPEKIVVGTSDRIIVLGISEGSLAPFWQTDPEPGANFRDVAVGDLEGDGREEIVTAASGRESIYVYRLAGEEGGSLRLELAGIRVVPGTPRFVKIFTRPGRNPAIAVAFEKKDGSSGLAVYTLTEGGFEAGPVLEGFPFFITALVSGDFNERPGQELAAGIGGMVWIIGTGDKLEVLTVTDSLGTAVSALAASEGEIGRLAAGTPGGYVFVFNFPAGKSPDLAFSSVEAVTGLAALPGGRVAVGTAQGGVQVWLLTTSEGVRRYIVGPGDNLWVISKKFGVSIEKILSLNENIKNPEVIMPGQVIKIPV